MTPPRFLRAQLSALVLLCGALSPQAAQASECSSSGSAGVDFIDLGVVCEQPGQGDPTNPVPAGEASPYVNYRWSSLCSNSPTTTVELECTASLTCDTPDLRRWQLWGRMANGNWVTIRTQCFGGTPPEFVPPTVTPGHVLSALRRVGLPLLETHVQPDGKTLINFDTIFHTDPETVSLNLTILGQSVDVEATPSKYLWVFGDGSSATTTTPGDPYPAKTVVHRYTDARVTVHPHVEVTYSARFRVNGGSWQDIPESVTTVGPDETLRIAEATPLLSGEHR